MAAVQVTAAQLPVVDPGAVDRIDLSTVVEHELGHVASPADLNALAGDVMSGALGAGVGPLASPHSDAVLAS